MDVRLPNGEVIKNVPEGTSRADLVAKLRRNGHDMSWVDGPSQTPAPATEAAAAPAEDGGDAGDVALLGGRSLAKLGKGLTQLPSAAAYGVGYVAGAAKPGTPESSFGEGIANARPSDFVPEEEQGFLGGLNNMGLEIKLGRKPTKEDIVAAQAEWDAENGDKTLADRMANPVAEKFGSAVRKFADPVTESRPITATREWFAEKEQDALDALSPTVRRAIELSLVEHDEEEGLSWGEGASDPWWWTANVIDLGAQMSPGIAATSVAARMTYAAKYRQVLGELSKQKIPQSVAIKEAEKQALKAATQSAVITGGLTEGAVAGGQNAAQMRETIESLNEETLMAYPGYMELRDKGMTHEQAREEIAKDKAAAIAISTGTLVGITGAPMNAYFGKLAAKFGRVAEAPSKGARAAIIAKGVAGEGAQEFVQEGGEQLLTNITEQPITGVDTWDGVLESAITGAVLGGLVGGGADAVVSGKKGKAPAEPTPPPPGSNLSAAKAAFDAANEALASAEIAARDPDIKIKYAEIQKLRDAKKQAVVDYTRELLHSGAFNEKEQAKVAAALKQAESEGLTAKGTSAVGGDISPQRDAALQAVANAEQVEEADANDLITRGMAKVNPRGVVVLTPAGRRARKAAEDRVKAEEKESSQAKVKTPAESTVKPAQKLVKKPVLRLPADRREAAVKREAERAERATKPRKDLEAERAKVAANKAITPDTIAGRAAELEASDAAHAAAGGKVIENPQMREAFAAAAKTARRARSGLPTQSTKRGAMRLKGQPETATIPGKGTVKVEPVKAATEAAANYRKAKGITTPHPTEYVKVDPARAKRIAKAFTEMKHEPNNPEVKRAYRAMIDETKAQWDEIKKSGLKVEFIKPGMKDPYAASPREAIEDVRNNNHLWVFPTDSGFGSGDQYSKDNPMLEYTGETVDGHKMKANDVFRIVHDYFGHVQEANGFRADGEENAWQIHASMYSPLARRAMTTETRGQNSWVNYGPKGEQNRTASGADTVYADQKIGLLPAEFAAVPGETLQFKHFSNAADLAELDPDKMGTGTKGAEAKRGGPKVISLYALDGEVEPDVANGRKRYDVEVPKADLYDASEDPQGLLRAAQVPYGMTTDAQGNTVPVGTRFDMNKFEELVRDAGYMGYHTPGASGILKGQARLFVRWPVKQEKKVEIAARMKRATSEEKVRGLLTPEENARLKKASARKLIEVFDELPDGAELAASAVAGEAKRGWYKRSSQALVNVFGPDAPRFAALLAALSPQTSVEWNFRNAVAVWVGWEKVGRPTSRKQIEFVMRENMFPNSKRVGKANILPAWVNNTVRALSTDDPSGLTLSGPKVDSFAANLRGETERVTLDAWMANWAGVDQALFKGGMTMDPTNPGLRPGYLAFSARVREAAEILTKRTGETWTAAEVQETVWSWAKTLYEEAESYGALATAREILDNKELTDDLINATPDFAGQFADPEISSLLRGTVYGDRAARSAGEAAAAGRTGRKTAPAPEDARHLRKAADRLDALRKARKAAEDETREGDGLRVSNTPTTGIDAAELDSVVARVKAELGVDAKIADTQADLPLYAQDLIPEGAEGVTGLFIEDVVTGETEIWFIRSNIDSKEEAYENALHETVGHMGLRAVLGKSYHSTMDTIRASFPAKVAWAARQNKIDVELADAEKRGDFAAIRRLKSLAAEELIAYAAGQVLAKRGALSEQSVWRKIVAKVRDILRNVGLLNSYSGEDIEALIYRARDYFRKPARTRAEEISYRGKIAMAVKSQPDGAPQWLDEEEYLAEAADAADQARADRDENYEGNARYDGREVKYKTVDASNEHGDEQITFPDDFDSILSGEDDFAGTVDVEAHADGRRIGYVTINESDVTPEGWSATYVYVNPRYRGTGVAQRMYKAVSDRLGVPATPARSRTPYGRSMWNSFKKRNVAFAYKQGPTGNVDLDSFISKIGVQPKSLRQRWNEFKHGLGERTAMALFDELHGIKAAEEIAGVDEKDMGYVSARLSRAAPEVVASIIENGPPVWNDGAPDVGQGMGLLSILSPLKGNVNLWLAYVAGRRASMLKGQGRENLFTTAEITAATALAQQHPEFDIARQQYNQLQKQVLDFAEEAGVIDPQTRAMWEHSDYVPFYRVMQGGEVTVPSKGSKGIGFVRNQIKQLKGGRDNIGDPLENIVRNWQALMDASLQAYAGRMTIDNLNGSGLVTPAKFVANAQPIQNLNALLAANPSMANALTAAGINIATLPPAAMAGLQKMLNIAPPAGEDVVTVWRDGRKEFWHVHDPNLYQSLKNINPKLWGPWMKLFSFPKRVITKTITLTPQFMVKNFWRDMWHTFVTGAQMDKDRINLLPSDSLAGLASALANSPDYKSMVAGGGGFGESFVESGDPASMAASVRRAISKGKSRSIVLDTPVKVWRAYRHLQNSAENANRVAVYKKARASGQTRRNSLYQARDLMDFSMRGNAEIIRLIVGMTPFFNARIQGLYRLGRGFKQNYMAVALRGLLLSAATVALLARNHDDERYKELTDQQKSNYWHFFTEDSHYMLPKPFEVGTIFGTIPEAIGDAMLSDQPDATKQAAKYVGYAFGETLSLAPQPATLWPLVELAINKDTFTGTPILTQGDESVLPEDQRGPNTSPTYAALARLMPSDGPEALRSPKQLEHLGRGYIGNIQDYVLLASDALVRKAMGEAAPPEKATRDLPGLRDFYRTGPARNTRYQTTMYDLANQAAKVQGSIKRNEDADTDEGYERVEVLETENAPLLDVAEDFKDAAKEVGDLKKEQRQIQLDPDMTPADKRIAIDEIQQEINDIAKDVYDLRPGGKLNSEMAADLLTAPPTARANILRNNNMPATADLLEQMG